ncbi:Hypothetical predicted protein, partial [Marmota monax]
VVLCPLNGASALYLPTAIPVRRLLGVSQTCQSRAFSLLRPLPPFLLSASQ